MRIGILAFRQDPYISANTAIAYAVGAEIAKSETVVYIGRKQDVNQSEIASHDGNKICYLNQKPKQNFTRIENKLMRLSWNKLGLFSDQQRLRQIVNEEKLDALICVTAPNENALIVQFAELSIPCYMYQLDPFYNRLEHENARLKKQFLSLLQTFQHVFTTDLLLETYRKDEMFKKYLSHFSALQFPNLIKPIQMAVTKDFPREKISMLYAGSLYHEIRSPQILIELRKILPNEVEINFCGVCDREEDMNLLIDSGIICKGYCSQEVLTQEKNKTTVFINIGNSVRNQLGSKIIEYMASGKPILNLIQFDKCPSCEILRKYDNSLSVYVSKLEESREKIISFIVDSRYKRLSWEQVLESYIEFTPEYAAKKIMDQIKG